MVRVHGGSPSFSPQPGDLAAQWYTREYPIEAAAAASVQAPRSTATASNSLETRASLDRRSSRAPASPRTSRSSAEVSRYFLFAADDVVDLLLAGGQRFDDAAVFVLGTEKKNVVPVPRRLSSHMRPA